MTKLSGWKPAVVVGIVFLGIILAPSTNALTVEPSWVELNGEYGKWVNTNILLINDENKTINVTIEPSSALSDMYISYPSLTLQPYEQKNITIGAQMDDIHGYITYTWENQQFNQFVLLTPMMGNVTVEMLNSNPEAGDTITFLLTPYVSGVGTVYVPNSGNTHSFNIVWGMASVELADDDYGDAVAVFTGEGFHTRYVFTIQGAVSNELILSAPNNVNQGDTKTLTLLFNNNPVSDVAVNITEPDGNNYLKFTDSNGEISILFDKKGNWKFNVLYNGMMTDATVTVKGEGGNGGQINLAIDVSGSVAIGDKKWITLSANGNPVPNNPITVYMPDGSITEYNTNSMGQLYFTFDSVGNYRFIASYKNATAQRDVTVSKKTMTITTPENAQVGMYATINVASGSTIEITGGGKTITGQTDSGEYSFKPEVKGQYTVHAYTDVMDGTAKFNVYEKPSINLYDMNDNIVVEAKKGQQYEIMITDNSGNVISEIDEIKILMPSGKPDKLMLTDGVGLWTPEIAGRYTFSIGKQGFYLDSSISVMVSGKASPSIGWGWGVIIIICIAVIVAAYKREKIEEWIKKRKEKGDKGKKEREEVE